MVFLIFIQCRYTLQRWHNIVYQSIQLINKEEYNLISVYRLEGLRLLFSFMGSRLRLAWHRLTHNCIYRLTESHARPLVLLLAWFTIHLFIRGGKPRPPVILAQSCPFVELQGDKCGDDTELLANLSPLVVIPLLVSRHLAYIRRLIIFHAPLYHLKLFFVNPLEKY